uniref:GSKIP domain-containing protein n=1 Tax=Acrobeloides nanus TaxID=290746 RepID=A0A914CFN1_9BILA
MSLGINSPIESIPMSLNKTAAFYSGPHSRGESSLELEAIAAVHQLSFAVQTISVSEMLPRTSELIFVNVTTMEGQPHCLELTLKGWRVTSLRSDCMQGDFTRLELFTKYYDSLYDLMEVISPGYKQRFNEKLEQRLRLLQAGEEGDSLAPASSYIGSPVFGSPDMDSNDHSHNGNNRSIVSA